MTQSLKDTRHNGTEHNETKNNETEHNDTEHNDTKHNGNLYYKTQQIDMGLLFLFILCNGFCIEIFSVATMTVIRLTVMAPLTGTTI